MPQMKKSIFDLIIGGGKYGEKAFEKIRKEQRNVIVIDNNPDCTVRKNYELPVFTPDDLICSPENTDINQTKGIFIQGGIKTVTKVISKSCPKQDNSKIKSTGDSYQPEYITERIFPTAPVHISAGIISEIAGFVPDRMRLIKS